MSRLEHARAVADAVLYEGYLLYPYRASSSKNQVRWQFGVVGPRGAAEASLGEAASITMQTLVRLGGVDPGARVDVHLRFLHVQRRRTERLDGSTWVDAPEVTVDGTRMLSWDEAVEVEHVLQAQLADLADGVSQPVDVHPSSDIEPLTDERGETVARLVRERDHVQATVSARLEPTSGGGLFRLTVGVDNRARADGLDKDAALHRSLVGTHLLLELVAPGCGFVSVIDPPADATEAAASCHQDRCWPVLAGEEGDDSLVLGSPIILYDHPEIAEESSVALFDSTEIDEILTLRVLTMTDAEKAEARATDPRAAAIVDRCEQMTPEEMQRLHGVLRDPAGFDPFPTQDAFSTSSTSADVDPFGPAMFGDDLHFDPEKMSVVIAGVRIGKDSFVRVRPNRRADAQDLFFRDQVARVTAVHEDFDGDTHVAVVLVDDPASDLHDWYGRYLYFAPDELEPLDAAEADAMASAHRRVATQRKESPS